MFRIRLIHNCLQRPGNNFEVGGGGQTSPGVQDNSYQKPKTPRISPTIFLGGTQVHVQKQTKMNGIDSPKMEGRHPSGPKVGGASAPAAPPPPGSGAYGCLFL